MTTRSQQPPVPPPHAYSALVACLVALAGTPDDASWITCQLITIAQLSADLIAPVEYASITACRDDTVITVTTSGDIAPDVDRAPLSIPLFAGRGTTVATLHLYGRDQSAFAPLTAEVRAVYDVDGPGQGPQHDALDDGGAALVAGLAGAFDVRAAIQQAIGAVMAATHRTADAAYLILRLRASETGSTLSDTAAAVITEQDG